jgi:hypothetical protein
MHLAAKVLASHAVAELMHGHDEAGNQQTQRYDPPLKEAGKLLNYISPIGERHANTAQNSNCGQNEKLQRKEKLDLIDQIIEEPVRIEESESQIEQAALDALCGRLDALVPATVQQAGCRQSAEESVQLFRRQRGLEFLLGTFSNDLELGFAIELAGDEVSLFGETIKPIQERIFDDKYDPLGGGLLTDCQIPAKPRQHLVGGCFLRVNLKSLRASFVSAQPPGESVGMRCALRQGCSHLPIVLMVMKGGPGLKLGLPFTIGEALGAQGNNLTPGVVHSRRGRLTDNVGQLLTGARSSVGARVAGGWIIATVTEAVVAFIVVF